MSQPLPDIVDPPTGAGAPAQDRRLGRIDPLIPQWHFLLLAKLGNQPTLRRHLGCQRTEALIAEIAQQIEALVPVATVAIAGRDMVEVAFSGAAKVELDHVLTTLDAAFAEAVDIDGERYRLDVSLGGAATVAPHYDEVRLIEEAEQALVQATTDRRPALRQVSTCADPMDRMALRRDLHHAADRGELFLQYQPKLHVRQQCIRSVEALIRWRHPTRGLVLPSDFIAIAEESSDIGALTLWTIRRAIADQRTLAEQGHELTIFINIAGVLLGDPRFVRQACELVQESGAQLGFEITETSVIRDPDSAIGHLKTLAEIGIAIAIDDYGAGLSSLAYLKQLPARELKIDKLFVTQLTSSNRDPLIVRSTIDLAHAMEMEVVAEGVETQAALALLSVMGCDMVQGYLISRPIGLDALIGYLDEDRHLAAPQDPRALLGKLTQNWRTG
jgi:diguanylate cyclase